MLFPQKILSTKWVPDAYSNYFSYPTYQLRDGAKLKATLLEAGFDAVETQLLKLTHCFNIEEHLKFSWDNVKNSLDAAHKDAYLAEAHKEILKLSKDGGVTAEFEAQCWIVLVTK